MNFLNELSNNNLAAAFGWTLLHSLWQFLIISTIVWVLVRFIFTNSSQTKYLIACCGLLMGVVASAVTFFTLVSQESAVLTTELSIAVKNNSSFADTTPSLNSLATFIEIIQYHMYWIIYGWMAGACIFSFRLIGGWWYLNRLTASATTMQGDLQNLLVNLSAKLGLRRLIELAETTSMVIGIFKPVILVPAGLMSGLTTAEIETIFLHELAHIRRHDYLVNLVQAFIEVIFFFNPFVWMLSGAI
jgi:bla regulator protein blaR1